MLGKYKYDLNVTLDNLKTVKNSMKFELKPSEIPTANNFGKKVNIISEIYNRIEKNVINVANDFQNLELHMKEIGVLFEKLTKQLKNNENAKKMENVFTKLNKIFTSWSVSCSKQNSFFREDFKSFFNYMNLEIQEMNYISQQFLQYKKDYEDYSAKLNKKKEDLFAQKDQSKWNVEPGTEDQIPKYVNNKKLAFEKMLFPETNLQSDEKRLIACTVHLMLKQFNKLLRCQSDNVHNYFSKMKQDNQIIVGDAFNLIKLFSAEKEE